MEEGSERRLNSTRRNEEREDPKEDEQVVISNEDEETVQSEQTQRSSYKSGKRDEYQSATNFERRRKERTAYLDQPTLPTNPPFEQLVPWSCWEAPGDAERPKSDERGRRRDCYEEVHEESKGQLSSQLGRRQTNRKQRLTANSTIPSKHS